MEVCLKNGARLARRCAALVLAACGTVAGPAFAQSTPGELADLTIENLLEMQITSVSREEQQFLSTPAAVFVITQQDIRRSGVTDVAELLRMVPGMNVARVNSGTWAISARGFNAQYATKLLVIIDGRSVYDPGFSGVLWQMQNLVLEDIERVEVIRGPGATMWGANAMNGLISITTKRATKTQGAFVTVDGGTGRPGEASARFGGGIGDALSYRAFARQTTRAALSTSTGEPGGDAWNMTNLGVRVDWEPSSRDTLTFQGEGYRIAASNREPILTGLAPVAFGDAAFGDHGGHVLGRWTRSLAPRSELGLQVYYDSRRRTKFGANAVDTLDVVLTQSTPLGRRHHFTWGVGYRVVRDHYESSVALRLTPSREGARIGSAFVQSEITLVEDALFVTIGSMFQESSFSGGNVQPAVRAVWQPTERQSLWASTARAVRTPNRAERGIRLYPRSFPAGPMVGLVEVRGQQDMTSEKLSAIEAGYRYQPTSGLWFDVSTFRNRYRDLSLTEPGEIFFEPAPQPHMVLPTYFTNHGAGSTYGAELTAHYQVKDTVTFKGSFSALRMRLGIDGTSAIAKEKEGESPQHQGYFGSTVKLPRDVDISGHIYMVGALAQFGVPAYTRLDLNTSWRATDHLRLKVVGQNLLGPHLEFGDAPSPSNQIGRGVHAEISLGF
jgi:iron complex outermembrane receptor protein